MGTLNDVDLVIFDCDGVLIDSELISCSVDAELLTESGYAISTEAVVGRFAGVPSLQMYATIEAEAGIRLPPDFAATAKARALEKYRTELAAIPGVAATLGALKTPRAVASSSEPAKLALGLIETGLYEMLYPHIYSATLVARGKPHPDIFHYAAKAMGTPAERCLVIEDSVVGVTAAKAAGMRCLGFTGGSHCAAGHDDRLRQTGAMDVMDHIGDLLDWVE